jgi:hypothetical protein
VTILACLLFCRFAVMAQDAMPGRHAEHGDAHAADDEFQHAEPFAEHRQESFVGWMIRCMGPIGLLIPVAGFLCFVLSLLVVFRGQGPFAFAALVFLVPIPFLLGLFGTVQGLILSLQVIATSSTSVKPSEISDGIATSLFNPMLGLVFMTPSYLVAVIGSMIRSMAKPAANS